MEFWVMLKNATHFIIWFKYTLDKYSKIQEYKNRIFYLLRNLLWKVLDSPKLSFFKLEKLTMTNILLILFFVLLFLLFIYSKRNRRLAQKITVIQNYEPFLKEYEFNPDINTDNWDLHKLRLDKFKRSQYKGLTFFVSLDNRIYYLSEEGDKVYC